MDKYFEYIFMKPMDWYTHKAKAAVENAVIVKFQQKHKTPKFATVDVCVSMDCANVTIFLNWFKFDNLHYPLTV